MMPAVTMRMTIVRMNVATFELKPMTPSFPKIAVNAAKKAEPNANSIQFELKFMRIPSSHA
jgi:hypothetical protein